MIKINIKNIKKIDIHFACPLNFVASVLIGESSKECLPAESFLLTLWISILKWKVSLLDFVSLLYCRCKCEFFAAYFLCQSLTLLVFLIKHLLRNVKLSILFHQNLLLTGTFLANHRWLFFIWNLWTFDKALTRIRGLENFSYFCQTHKI